MYDEYYGLSGNPFRLTPDIRFWFGSESHRKAMSYLKYGLYQGEGFIVITGDVGTGKSTLVGQLFSELDQNDVVAAQIGTTQIDADEAIRLICASFGVKPGSSDKAVLLAAFQEFLIAQNRAGRRVLLVVDEAQNLPVRTLEELRMLSNFNDNGQPLFQSFLVGQPQFLRTLAHPDLAQLQQRVIASYRLEAMGAEETREYVEHRLSTVGWKGDPDITSDAFDRIFSETRGVPRRINTLCNRVMLFGSLEGLHAFDAQVIESVIQDLQKEVLNKTTSEVSQARAAAHQQRSAQQHQQRQAPQQQARPVDNAESRALEERINRIDATLNEHDKALRELVEFAMTLLGDGEEEGDGSEPQQKARAG